VEAAPLGSTCEEEGEGEGEIGRREGPPATHQGDEAPSSEPQLQADLGCRRAKGGDPDRGHRSEAP